MPSSTDSSLSSLFDELDEPRAPSRLDFCIEDSGGSPTQRVDSVCTCAHDSFPFTFIDEDAFAVDIAPPDHPCFLIADLPQAADSHIHNNVGTSHTYSASSTHTMGEVVIEPRAPTPVRPLSVQFRDDTPEFTLPPRAARLNYPHRGFSRSALLQQKTLWNSRHEEWRSRMEQSDTQKQVALGDDAYAGIAISQSIATKNPSPYARTPPSGLERDLVDHPHRNHSQSVHSSIFPRVGDISALRDPYAVNIDRCFFRYPLWTLHKTLYIFNVHQRSAVPALSPSVCGVSQSQSSVSLSTSSSYTSSTAGVDEEPDSTAATDDSLVSKTPCSLESGATSSLHGPPSWSHFCSWELSWYARWELLIGLFQRDRTKCDTLDVSMELVAPPECKTTPTFRYCLGDKDGGDDDDEDDYGTLISNLSLSVDFDEECERAMAFYGREVKYSAS